LEILARNSRQCSFCLAGFKKSGNGQAVAKPSIGQALGFTACVLDLFFAIPDPDLALANLT
jgi:hypothetical protein